MQQLATAHTLSGFPLGIRAHACGSTLLISWQIKLALAEYGPVRSEASQHGHLVTRHHPFHSPMITHVGRISHSLDIPRQACACVFSWLHAHIRCYVPTDTGTTINSKKPHSQLPAGTTAWCWSSNNCGKKENTFLWTLLDAVRGVIGYEQ